MVIGDNLITHRQGRLDYAIRHVHGFKKAPGTIYIRLFKRLTMVGIRMRGTRAI